MKKFLKSGPLFILGTLLFALFMPVPVAAGVTGLSLAAGSYLPTGILASSANPNDLSCTDLATSVVRASEMWSDDRTKIQYIPNADTAIAVIANDTARKEYVTGDKDRDVKVMWINDCDDGENVNTNEAVCDLGGDELTSGCQSYSLDKYASRGFSINHTELFAKEVYDQELVAIGLLNKVRILDEIIAKDMVALIDAVAGTNANTNNNYTQANGATYIPAVEYNPALFAYFIGTARLNKFTAPWLLGDYNLRQMALVAGANQGNADGKGDANLVGSMVKYYDEFNIASEIGEKATYMLNRGSIAFASKVRYPNTQTLANRQFTKINSLVLPGVEYQVIHEIVCRNDAYWHDFKVEARYGIFHNPVGCNTGNTGVLKFVCGQPA